MRRNLPQGVVAAMVDQMFILSASLLEVAVEPPVDLLSEYIRLTVARNSATRMRSMIPGVGAETCEFMVRVVTEVATRDTVSFSAGLWRSAAVELAALWYELVGDVEAEDEDPVPPDEDPEPVGLRLVKP